MTRPWKSLAALVLLALSCRSEAKQANELRSPPANRFTRP